MSTHFRNPDSQSGFSLIEVLVAFAILSLSLGVITQIYSRGIQSLGLGDSVNQATMLADSLLASAAYEMPAGSSRKGQHQYIEWRIETRPYEPAAGEHAMELQVVHVNIEWQEHGRKRSLSVSSLRPVINP